MDHNFSGEGPPLIFETMIFDHSTDDSTDSGYMERYSTEEDALIGHTIAVKYAQKLMKQNENK